MDLNHERWTLSDSRERRQWLLQRRSWFRCHVGCGVRAWQVQRHGPSDDALRLVNVEEPVPGPGELRLRVRAAGIGLPDALMCRGSYAFSPTLSFVPGQEVCGTVDALGSGVEVPLGTRLMAVTNFFDGHGGFAEATIVRSDSAFRVPDAMRDEDAAAFRIGYSTGYIGLVRRGALQSGEWLLVLGAAGGSGLAAVQLGEALGRESSRSSLVRQSGNCAPGRARTSSSIALWDRCMTSSWRRRRVAGSTSSTTRSVVSPPGRRVRCLAPAGRLLAVGFASGEWVEVDVSELVWRNASIVGVYAGGQTRAEAEADHDLLLTLAADGSLGRATRTVPFDALPEALNAVDRAEAVGKLVLHVGEVDS